MNHKKKWIILPVEVKVRDLESRILLALFFIQKGYGVILGSHLQINRHIDLLPGGIYFDKSIAKNKLDHFKKIREKFRIVALDEEGLSSLNNERQYINQRISRESLKLTDIFFTWGLSEKEMIKEKYPDTSCRIIAIGNPRLDLYRRELIGLYKDRTNKITQEYGNYILMPSNFSIMNEAQIDATLTKLKNLGRIQNEEDKKYYLERFEYQKKILSSFVKIAKNLSDSLMDRKIIVRPHPSENINEWKRILVNHSNILVVYNESIAPWILASDMVIHSSCTTGLEAFLLGKPVISYVPDPNHEISKHISNSLSCCFQSDDNLIEWVKKFFIGINTMPNNLEKQKIIGKHISSLNGKYSVELITREIEKIQISKEILEISLFKIRLIKFKSNLSSVLYRLYNYISFNSRFLKFPDTNAYELKTKMDQLILLLGSDDNVSIDKIDKNLFCLTKHN
jgi:surface carbohydrate biosynthesis protein